MLGIAATVLGVALEVKEEVDLRKREQEVLEARQDVRAEFDRIASVVERGGPRKLGGGHTGVARRALRRNHEGARRTERGPSGEKRTPGAAEQGSCGRQRTDWTNTRGR